MKLPIFYCNDCDLYITGNSDDVEKFSQKIYPETYWKERDPKNLLICLTSKSFLDLFSLYDELKNIINDDSSPQ